MASLRVINPGLLSTVQDLGRPGFASLGVPEGGACDPISLRVGNRLVGNPEGAAAVEVTLASAEFEVTDAALVAVCGGGRIDLRPVRAKEVVRVEPPISGCRSYLCIHGGIEVPFALGSRSTCLPGGFGGLAGRSLRAGDLIEIGPTTRPSASDAWARGRDRLSADLVHWLGETTTGRDARIVRAPCPIDGAEAMTTLTHGPWQVSSRSDRSGVRLIGECGHSADRGRMISEGMPLGAVQIPEGGEPIILMQDRPVTGGYPVIGCVIEADIPLVGQWRPGAAVRLREVGLEEARTLGRRQEETLVRLLAHPV